MKNCYDCKYLTAHESESQLWICFEDEEKRPIAMNQSDIERIKGSCIFFEGMEESK